MVARPILAIISLILLAGGIVLQFFIILSGGINSDPINQIYFLEATTNGITPQPRNPTRWTYFALCGANDKDNNVNCGDPVPALPFSPRDDSNFGTQRGLPGDFDGNYYYYLSRFAWVFLLLALLFAAMGLATGLIAMCSRIGGYLSGMIVIVALFFQTLAAALYTTWIVKGRDAFKSDGQDAKVGVKALAFLWTSMTCFFLSTILFCIGGAVGRDKHNSSSAKGSRFGRSKSKRSRGSFDS